ncbi:hypothetical protein SprV_0602150400 [Sparganum proliferum]
MKMLCTKPSVELCNAPNISGRRNSPKSGMKKGLIALKTDSSVFTVMRNACRSCTRSSGPLDDVQMFKVTYESIKLRLMNCCLEHPSPCSRIPASLLCIQSPYAPP